MSDDYGSLQTLVDKVVEEACYSELKLYGWYPDGSGNVTYISVGLGGGPAITAAGPGHGYPDDLVSPNGGYIDQTGNGLDAPATLGQLYAFWESSIPPVFEPFFGLPEPEEFQALADKVREALKQLSTEGNTGSGQHVGRRRRANIDYEGNTTIGLANQVAQTLNTWQGAAAASFATYLNLFQRGRRQPGPGLRGAADDAADGEGDVDPDAGRRRAPSPRTPRAPTARRRASPPATSRRSSRSPAR